MKKIILLIFISLQVFTLPIFAQFGYLDSSFHGDGIVTTDFGANSDFGGTVALQSDGKIIVVGSGSGDFAIARYNQNGYLDSSFNNDGKVTTDIGNYDNRGNSVVIDQNGKIILAGTNHSNLNKDFAILRYLSNGLLDSSFNNDGKVTTDFGQEDNCRSVVIQNDGKIVVAGYNFSFNTYYDFIIARYLENGTLDTTFNNNGMLIYDFGGTNFGSASSIVIQQDGKIVIGGVYSSSSNDNEYIIMRLLQNGSFDSSFSNDGIVTTNIGSAYDYGESIAIQSNDKIIMCGYSFNGLNSDFSLIRYLPNGSLDSSFGNNGLLMTDINNDEDFARCVKVQSDNKIIVAGYTYKNNDVDFAIVRYHNNGDRDSSFGNNGIITTDVSGNNKIDYGNSVAIQHDNKIIVAGYSENNSNYNFALARYISGLSLGVIDFSTAIDQALIYPNPITNNTKLSYNLTNTENISIYLLDMTGRKLKTFLENKQQIAGSYEQVISLPENLPAGTYLLVVSSGKRKVTVKVMKD